MTRKYGIRLLLSFRTISQDVHVSHLLPADILTKVAFGIVVVGQGILSNNNPPNLLTPQNAGTNLEILFSQDTNAVGLTLGCIDAAR